MLYAPTMRVPSNVDHTINAYLASKAALNSAKKLGLNSVVFPGMGTGTGNLPFEEYSRQISMAIKDTIIHPATEPLEVYDVQTHMFEYIVPKKWFTVQYIY